MGRKMTVMKSVEPSSPQGKTRWDRFLYWANRFYTSDEFDKNERDYKLVVAARLQEAKATFFENEPSWVEKLNHAITAPPNNLTNWRATQPLISWCRAEPEHASLAFRFLWNTDDRVQQRFDQFVEVVSNAGQRIYIAETSFFHMVVDPLAFPMHRATAVERAMDLTGYPEPKEVGIKSGEIGRRYEHFMRFLDIMLKRAQESGIQFRDRLDAQGAAWTVTQWRPLDDWSESDKQAFVAYQGGAKLRKESWPSL
jgi:hypothetical protein